MTMMIRSLQRCSLGIAPAENIIVYCSPERIWWTWRTSIIRAQDKLRIVVDSTMENVWNRVKLMNMNLLIQRVECLSEQTTLSCTEQQKRPDRRTIFSEWILDQIESAFWFAVPKKRVTRSKKRMKTTVQKRIKIKQNIIVDPRTKEVTLQHKLPFNWKDYLPKVE